MEQANDNRKGNASRAAAVALLALALIAGGWAVSGTLAKYATSVGGTSTASVAKFDVSAGSLNADGSATVDLFSTTKTFKEDGVTENDAVAAGRVAPGTGGKFDVELSSKSEVAVAYELTCDVDAKGLPLEFSSDGTTWKTAYEPVTGDLGVAENGAAKTVTKTVYWRWAFERGDTGSKDANNVEDTGFGTGSSVSPEATVSVEFAQKPAAAAAA